MGSHVSSQKKQSPLSSPADPWCLFVCALSVHCRVEKLQQSVTESMNAKGGTLKPLDIHWEKICPEVGGSWHWGYLCYTFLKHAEILTPLVLCVAVLDSDYVMRLYKHSFKNI